MSNVLQYKGYYAKPEYSVEDQIFYGKILGIQDLVDFYSESAKEIEKEFHHAVDDYLEFCAEIAKEPQKAYSGSFNIRISPELHRKAAIQAQVDGSSLNKVCERALEQYLLPKDTSAPVFVSIPGLQINSEDIRLAKTYSVTEKPCVWVTSYRNQAKIS